MSDADIQIPVQSVDEARTLLGPLDSNARLIRELHGVSVLARDGSLRLLGDADHVLLVQQVLDYCTSPLHPRVGPDPPGTVRLTSGGAFHIPHDRAGQLIGWQPKVAMREGVQRLLAWRAAQLDAAGKAG